MLHFIKVERITYMLLTAITNNDIYNYVVN